MMKRTFVGMIALIAASLAPSMSAQDVYIPDSSTITGPGDGVLFGLGSARYQYVLVRGEVGPSGAHQKITELAFVPLVSGTFNATWCQIRMDRGFSKTLTSCFVQNAPCPLVVYEGPLTINAVKDTWTAIGLQRAYVSDGSSNVVIEIRYRGGSGTAIPVRTADNVLGSSVFNNTAADPYSAPCPQAGPEMRIPYTRITINNQNVLIVLDHNHLNFTVPFRIRNAPPLSFYYLAASFGQGTNGPIPVGSYNVWLDPDPLFFFSIANPNSVLFQGYQGLIGPNGSDGGSINFYVPNIPALVGLCVSHAAVFIDRSGSLLGVTNTGVTEIEPPHGP